MAYRGGGLETVALGYFETVALGVSQCCVSSGGKVLEYGVYDMAATNSHGREAKKPILVAVSFLTQLLSCILDRICETSQPSDKSCCW